MLETNIRLVQFGANLHLDVRCAEVITQDVSAALLERACGALLKRRGLAAVKAGKNASCILVVSRNPVPQEVIEEDNWRLEVKDTGQLQRLHFRNADDQTLMAQLLERCLIAQIARRTKLWRMPNSNRIWYQSDPFDRAGDVAAYRRYEIASIAIDDIGVGLIVDVSTAFFTTSTVADFFREDIPQEERKRLQRRFEQLSARQQEQKGTLLYDLGTSQRNTCYFDSFCDGITVATTGGFRLQGVNYDSLQDYYKKKHGVLVSDDEPVAKVSFKGIDRPVPVAASKLKLRLMNDALPRRLKNVDKIDPASRRTFIEGFWTQLEETPLGRGLPLVEKRFWRPPPDRIIQIKAPDLLFGGGKVLTASLNGHIGEYRTYYRERLSLLDEAGCFHVPPAVTRVLHIAIPQTFEAAVAEQLAEAVTNRLSNWMRIEINAEWFLYRSLEEAINKLRREEQAGVVLFVFDQDDPATYFNLTYELKEWRIKRITQGQLSAYAAEFRFEDDATNSRKVTVTQYPKGWNAFIEMTALDVLQQMDCVPWTFANPLHYEAHLAIDVGIDRRHFALSLLICRPQSDKAFRIDTVVAVKADSKKETINDIHLRDEIIRLCQRAKQAGFNGLRSILVSRDGRERGREMDGIDAAREELIRIGFLSAGARADVIDFHKKSVKGIRLWDCSPSGTVRNTIEGKGLRINEQSVVLVNTGAATLHQGTAEPVMLEARSAGVDIVTVVTDEHATCHLNWSNPRVAQRLPLELKQTDDQLKNRAAQEIRRIK